MRVGEVEGGDRGGEAFISPTLSPTCTYRHRNGHLTVLQYKYGSKHAQAVRGLVLAGRVVNLKPEA